MMTLEEISQEPQVVAINLDGAKYIPINVLEDELDRLDWSTSNFAYGKDGDEVYGAIMLSVDIYDGKSSCPDTRTFIGAANFNVRSIDPNTHWIATLKSECIKNASSDIGRRFGRNLNENIIPSGKSESGEIPDSDLPAWTRDFGKGKIKKLNTDAEKGQNINGKE